MKKFLKIFVFTILILLSLICYPQPNIHTSDNINNTFNYSKNKTSQASENYKESIYNELLKSTLNISFKQKTYNTHTIIENIKNNNLNNKKSLKNNILAYTNNIKSKIGLVYYNFNTGEVLKINEDKVFLAASTVKVPMNMVLFDMILEEKININEKLQYNNSYYESGTGILQNSDLSNPINLQTLSDYSILHSDNIATNMIMNRIGYQTMRDKMDKKLGYETNHAGNYITPNQAFKFLQDLYWNKNKNPYYPKLLDIMKNTDFHDRIDADIPQEMVAHKIGNYADYVNDIGIVYTNSPYILVVYTKDLKNANETISEISKIIYSYQQVVLKNNGLTINSN